ncbi:ribonuclease HII [bacterium]|nr:ribonuclease HII [bacterium]
MESVDSDQSPAALFFDGHRPLALSHRWTDTPQIMVTKGDDLLKSISASSVIAKVVRDRWMEMYACRFPFYLFNEHRGYGTEKHREALLKHGLSPLHRKTFLKNICPVHSN